jgi:hypothetical protein
VIGAATRHALAGPVTGGRSRATQVGDHQEEEMTRRSNLFAALAMATVAGVAVAQETSVTVTPTLFALAATEYEHGHWLEAFAAFARLADRCEAEPARIAVLMWRHGPMLYRAEFEASREQIQRWARLAAGTKETGCVASTDRRP